MTHAAIRPSHQFKVSSTWNGDQTEEPNAIGLPKQNWGMNKQGSKVNNNLIAARMLVHISNQLHSTAAINEVQLVKLCVKQFDAL